MTEGKRPFALCHMRQGLNQLILSSQYTHSVLSGSPLSRELAARFRVAIEDVRVEVSSVIVFIVIWGFSRSRSRVFGFRALFGSRSLGPTPLLPVRVNATLSANIFFSSPLSECLLSSELSMSLPEITGHSSGQWPDIGHKALCPISLA